MGQYPGLFEGVYALDCNYSDNSLTDIYRNEKVNKTPVLKVTQILVKPFFPSVIHIGSNKEYICRQSYTSSYIINSVNFHLMVLKSWAGPIQRGALMSGLKSVF